MPDQEDAINVETASNIAKVSRAAIEYWIKEGILEKYEIAKYTILSRKELEDVLAVREKNPRNWKQDWLKQKKG